MDTHLRMIVILAAVLAGCGGSAFSPETVPADDSGSKTDGADAEVQVTTDAATGDATDAGSPDVGEDAAPEATPRADASPEAGPLPSTCAEAGGSDGSYTLYLGGDPTKPWTAYCHNELEYLTLPTSATNYSQFTAGNSPAVGTNVRTSYTRVRFVVDLGEVDISDQTFATSTGMIQIMGYAPTVTSMLYGVAASCDYTDNGIAMVDLTGTSFSVAPGQFTLGGASVMGSAVYSNNNRVVNLSGVGGNCGWEGPGTLGGQGTVGGVQLALQYSP
jgi:hypothetical protein